MGNGSSSGGSVDGRGRHGSVNVSDNYANERVGASHNPLGARLGADHSRRASPPAAQGYEPDKWNADAHAPAKTAVGVLPGVSSPATRSVSSQAAVSHSTAYTGALPRLGDGAGPAGKRDSAADASGGPAPLRRLGDAPKGNPLHSAEATASGARLPRAMAPAQLAGAGPRALPLTPPSAAAASEHPPRTTSPSRPGAAGASGAALSKSSRSKPVADDDGSVMASVRRASSTGSSSLRTGSPRRRTVGETRALLQTILDPPPGQLECVASGFLTVTQYASLRGLFLPFTTGALRDKWYIDAAMLAALGRDGWRSSKNRELLRQTNAPAKRQIRELLLHRMRCTHALRELILTASGAVGSGARTHDKSSLQALLKSYKEQRSAPAASDEATSNQLQRAVSPSPSATPGSSPGVAAVLTHGAYSSVKGSETAGSQSSHDGDDTTRPGHAVNYFLENRSTGDESIHVHRLKTNVTVSFECYHLIAKCLPAEVVSDLPAPYLRASTPVVWSGVSYQERLVGEISRRCFFVTLDERLDLLLCGGRDDQSRAIRTRARARAATAAPVPLDDALCLAAAADSAEQNPTQSSHKAADAHATAASDSKDAPTGAAEAEPVLETSAHLYAALRSLGLTLTTACSTMVLYVLLQLAEGIKLRRQFRETQQQATERGITVQELMGSKAIPVKHFTGECGDSIHDWKQFVMTDEMSLPVFTKLLLQKYRKENNAATEKLRKRYLKLFTILEMLEPASAQEAFDAPRSLGNTVLKLMFLFGGGQRSIEADDCRTAERARASTDDLNISRMLEVPVLNTICWVACMLDIPVMSPNVSLLRKRRDRPLTFYETSEITGSMRELFQAVGALPPGSSCPAQFQDWLPLFPFYAVNTEGKRILTHLYCAHAAAVRPLALTVQKDAALLSAAKELAQSATLARGDVVSYLLQPKLVMGYSESQGGSRSTPGHTGEARAREGSVRAGAEEFCGSHARSPSASADKTASQTHRASSGKAADARVARDGRAASPVATVRRAAPQVEEKASKPRKPSATRRSRDAGSVGSSASHSSRSSSSSSGGGSSCSSSVSTLMDAGLNIDVYTCVAPTAQLYLRCTNEATVRRHRTVELTPFLSVDLLASASDVELRRPDLYAGLGSHLHAMHGNEGLLVVRWTCAEPVVTFRPGDVLAVELERSSLISLQNPRGSLRYFNNAPRRASEAVNGLGEDAPSAASLANNTMQSPRRHSVVIDAGGLEPDSKGQISALSPMAGGGIALPHRVTDRWGSRYSASNASDTMAVFPRPASACTQSSEGSLCLPRGYGSALSFDDTECSRSGSLGGSFFERNARRLSDSAAEQRGDAERAVRRVGARWTVTQIYYPTGARTSDDNGGGGEDRTAPPDARSSRGEIILRVHSPDAPLTGAMRLRNIGHERGSMAPFRNVGSDPTNSWTNPRLVSAVVAASRSAERAEQDGQRDSPREADEQSRRSRWQGSPSTGRFSPRADRAAETGFTVVGDNGDLGAALCRTEKELHEVFYAVGVLLANGITNAMFVPIPFSSLSFWLLKKAISTGDHNFQSFAWLVPSVGNLLSPTALLNVAYAVMDMTDASYLAYLNERGIARPENYIIPPTCVRTADSVSVAAQSFASDSAAADRFSSPRGATVLRSGGSNNSSMRFSTSSVSTTAIEEERQLAKDVARYLALIQRHNREGGMLSGRLYGARASSCHSNSATATRSSSSGAFIATAAAATTTTTATAAAAAAAGSPTRVPQPPRTQRDGAAASSPTGASMRGRGNARGNGDVRALNRWPPCVPPGVPGSQDESLDGSLDGSSSPTPPAVAKARSSLYGLEPPSSSQPSANATANGTPSSSSRSPMLGLDEHDLSNPVTAYFRNYRVKRGDPDESDSSYRKSVALNDASVSLEHATSPSFVSGAGRALPSPGPRFSDGTLNPSTSSLATESVVEHERHLASIPTDAREVEQLLADLPSREEYIAVYLVNEMVWSSVERNGVGGRTKNLWASFVRGFLTSPLAKSPLMTHCCSRVIREVLCVPNGRKSNDNMHDP